ncbi:MAG: GUN4 domain-containing protein [Sphaerospermopsis kisseleviana]
MAENQEPQLPILTGKKGRYQLLKLIGKGGFGYTFLAEDLNPVVEKHYCVVKELRMDVYHDPKTIAGIKKAFKKLGDRIGWRQNGEWLSYDSYTFSTNAPSGHLPRCRDGCTGRGRGGYSFLFSSL